MSLHGTYNWSRSTGNLLERELKHTHSLSKDELRTQQDTERWRLDKKGYWKYSELVGLIHLTHPTICSPSSLLLKQKALWLWFLQKEKRCLQILVQEIPNNLETVKGMSQQVSLLFFPSGACLQQGPDPAVGCLSQGPDGSCGWQFLLCWWQAELLPRPNEATSKITTTTTINRFRALLQPRLVLCPTQQSQSGVHTLLTGGC